VLVQSDHAFGRSKTVRTGRRLSCVMASWPVLRTPLDKTMPGSFGVCRRGPSLTGRVRLRGRPVGSVLGAYEGIHQGDVLPLRHRHHMSRTLLSVSFPDVGLPGDPQSVQGLGEQTDDVGGDVGEVVTRILVVALPVPLPDAIVRTAAVGVDETPDELFCVFLDHGLLPGLQDDESVVFLARTVLMKKARPVQIG